MCEEPNEINREHIRRRPFSKGLSSFAVMVGLACVAVGSGDVNRASANPIQLTPTQMDGITAGAISHEIVAAGIAEGEPASSDAKAKVRTISTPNVDVSIGVGKASAKGESHDVELSSSYTTDGRVIVDNTRVIEINTPKRSVGVVVAVIVAKRK